MDTYSTLQLYSFAIIVIFSLYLLLQMKRLVTRRAKPQGLLGSYRTLKQLKAMPWDDFERLSMELFSHEGWQTRGNTKKGADGGVDIWMQKSGTKAIVQCKRYSSAVVGVKVVREMYGLMYEYQVDRAYIVTTSRFTKEAYRFVKGKEMVLLDGKKLLQMINKH